MEVLYPGADWNPGFNAGYTNGRNRMEVVKAHFTVGKDSTSVGLRGYFQWLISRDGYVQQFAEADALCWDSGEWNDNGPGIEIEYLDEDAIFTDAARTSCSKLIHWLNGEWGVPLTYWDAGRITETTGYRGFIAHRDLVQTEQHTDYWPQADWDAMTSGGFLMALSDEEQIGMYRAIQYLVEGSWQPPADPTYHMALFDRLAEIEAKLLTEADVARIVDAELTGRKFVVPPLGTATSVSARNMAAVSRKTTLGSKD